MEELVETPEYAAAWDLELWKALQIQKFQREMKEKERKATDEMRARIQKTEREENAQSESRLRDVRTREGKLKEAQDALEKKKLRLKESEQQLQRQMEEAAQFRKRLEEESDARVARVKDEVAHRLHLQEQKVAEAKEQTKRIDDRLQGQQREYARLWDEFSDFKTKTLTQSGPLASAQIDTARARYEQHAVETQRKYEQRLAEAAGMADKRIAELLHDLKKTQEELAQRKAQTKIAKDKISTLTEERDEARRDLQRLEQNYSVLVAATSASNSVSSPHAHNQQIRSGSHSPVHINVGGGHGPATVPRPHLSKTARAADAARMGATVGELAALREAAERGHDAFQQSTAASRFKTSPLATAAGRGGEFGETFDVPDRNSSPAGFPPQSAVGGGVDNGTGSSGEEDAEVRRLKADIRQWRASKAELMESSGGAYTSDSSVIVDLDKCILQAQERLALKVVGRF